VLSLPEQWIITTDRCIDAIPTLWDYVAREGDRSVAVENAKSRDKPRTTRRLPTAWHTYLALPVQRDQSGLIGTPSYNSKQVKRWKTGSGRGRIPLWFWQARVRYGHRGTPCAR